MSTVEIGAKDVKALRERTGAGMMDCKKALTEAEGDVEKAIEILRVKQGKKIQDLGERAATEGTVQAYVHAGSKVGVLIEVDCNTDFVAKNDDFVGFAREVAMQIAATPTVKYVSREDVPRGAARGRVPHLRAGGRRQARERARENRLRQARLLALHDRAARAGDAQPEVRRQDRPAAARRAHRDDRRERRHPAVRALRHRPIGQRTVDTAHGLTGRLAFDGACLQTHPAEALRRGADGGARLRHRPRARGRRGHGRSRTLRDQGVEVAIVVGARQHLPRDEGRRRRHGPRHRRLHGHAGHRHQRPGRCRTRWRRRAPTPACRPPSASPRWPSPTSAAGPCATWRRAAW